MDIKVDENTVVVFDLDDTLYNELDFLKSAYISIAKKLEPKDYYGLFVQMISMYRSKENVFEVISTRYGLKIGSLIEMYRNHTPDIKLFDGAWEVLEKIKKQKGRIGLVTDGRIQTQMSKINALKIRHFMDKIVISEALGTEKPHLNNFNEIQDNLLGNCYYYIADNLKKDFIAPNKLGWKTIGLIDNGLNIHHHAHLFMNKEHRPGHFVMSFEELHIC